MIKVLGIKFKGNEKIYDFDAGDLDLQVNDQVVVKTETDLKVGTVKRRSREKEILSLEGKLKKVIRKADEDDIVRDEKNRRKEREVFGICLKKIKEHDLPMKLIKVEYLYDGSKIIFYFGAEKRLNFRELVKDLAQEFSTKIEMRQIGSRNEAKIAGGIGLCGREFCCSSFLKDFEPVTIRMAKDQGLALDPVKISGSCGRLICCLAFEFDTYAEAKKKLPLCGKKVTTPLGVGKVIKQKIMEEKLVVKLEEDKKLVEFPADDVKVT